MEDNAVEDDDIDFSIINPDNEKHKALNFSVNQLLDNPKISQNKQSSIQPQSQQPQQVQPQGSFLRDLEKLEHQVSYDTNPYDIYQPQQQHGQFTGTGEGKQQQTCTKTINNLTKICEKFVQNDFKHLILDFADQKGSSNLKTKQSFQDYFQGSILKTKKISINQLQKVNQTKTKSIVELTYKNSTSKNKIKLANSSKKNSSSKSKQQKTSSQLSKKYIDIDKNRVPRKDSSRSLSSKSNKSKTSVKSKQKYRISQPSQIHKQIKNKQQSQIYSEYYGFDEPRKQVKKKKSRSSSKGKKIIFSKKNVNVYN